MDTKPTQHDSPIHISMLFSDKFPFVTYLCNGRIETKPS